MPGDPEDLKRLCGHAAVALDAAGATLLRVRDICRDNRRGNGGVEFVAASNAAATALGRAEAASMQGPGVEAARSGCVVVVDDVAASRAWPGFVGPAREFGVSSLAALPVIVDDRPVGVIDIYRDGVGSWSLHDLAVGRTVTDIARILMSQTTDLDRATSMIEQLQGALEHRAVIEQAKGMIARDHRVSVDAAFEILRRHSRNSNTPVRVLARAITEFGVQIPVPHDGQVPRRPPRRAPAPTTSPNRPSDLVPERS